MSLRAKGSKLIIVKSNNSEIQNKIKVHTFLHGVFTSKNCYWFTIWN